MAWSRSAGTEGGGGTRSALGSLLAIPLLLTACSAEDGGVDGTTTGRVTGEADWVWETEDRTSADELVLLPEGVVVVHEEGIVALDRSSGEALWSHSGRNEGRAEAVADGSLVAWETTQDGGEDEVWLLDATDGEVVERVPAGAGERVFTGDLHIREEGSSNEGTQRLVAGPLEADLAGDPLWSAEHLRCESEPGFRGRSMGLLVVGDTLVVPYTCVEDLQAWNSDDRQTVIAGVRGLDVRTGEETWTREEVLENAFLDDSYSRYFTPINGVHVMTGGSEHRPGTLLDARTGETPPGGEGVFAAPEDLAWAVETRGRGHYALLDSDGGEQATIRFPDGAALLGVSAVDGGLAAVGDPETEPRLLVRSWEGGAESDVDLRNDLDRDLARVLRSEADGDRIVILYQTSDKRVGVAGFTWPEP